jgi:hypothetical protein
MRLLVALTLASLLSALHVAGAAAASPEISVCGQIANGPFAAWTLRVGTPVKLKGTTWTVFAVGVPCSNATRASRALLETWPQAKVGKRMKNSPKGYVCSRTGGAAAFGCVKSVATAGAASFSALMTGKYSLAEVKAFVRGGLVTP